MRPKRSELAKLYGPIDVTKAGDTVASYRAAWPDSAKWLTTALIPLRGGIQITCHAVMKAPLQAAFQNITDRRLLSELHSFDGCWVVRNTRGKTSLSVHAYGLAIDINADENHLGTRGIITPELVKCFTDAGFVWGGAWHRPDGMHFQYVTED